MPYGLAAYKMLSHKSGLCNAAHCARKCATLPPLGFGRCGKLSTVIQDPAGAAVSLCGCPGRLSVIGVPPSTERADTQASSERCFVWRTDGRLLGCAPEASGAQRSLFEVACDVAELYHRNCVLRLAEGPREALEVIWLELAADDSLLVFLKPADLRYA